MKWALIDESYKGAAYRTHSGGLYASSLQQGNRLSQCAKLRKIHPPTSGFPLRVHQIPSQFLPAFNTRTCTDGDQYSHVVQIVLGMCSYPKHIFLIPQIKALQVAQTLGENKWHTHC